jgi:hypothetical protein
VPIEVIREEYNRESLPLKEFIEKRCVINPSRNDYYTLEDEFNKSLSAYCKENSYNSLNATQIEVELARYKVFKGRKQLQGHKKFCYKGIIMIDAQTQEALLPV